MIGVLTGFAVVAFAVIAGYVVGRAGILGVDGQAVLGRLAFFVLNPILMFVVLSEADIGTLFSSLLPVSALAALAVFLIYAVVAKVFWKRSLGDVWMGALSAGQVNGNNMGIPISTYVLGSAAYAAPIILMQQILFTPISLAVLDGVSTGEKRWWRALGRAVRNPMIIGSTVGVIVALTRLPVPEIVMEPLDFVSHAAVPVILISFGMSLNGQRALATRGTRRDVLLATALKLVIMPLLAYAIGLAFGLEGHALLVVVVLATLPTAQNIFNFAQRYGVGYVIARDTVFLTTLGALPLIFLAALILG